HARLLVLAGGWRRQGRHGLWPDLRGWDPHCQGPLSRPRLPRDDFASDGHLSQAADVPLCRPRLPPHRRPRQRTAPDHLLRRLPLLRLALLLVDFRSITVVEEEASDVSPSTARSSGIRI